MTPEQQLRLEALRLAVPADRPHQQIAATLTTANRYLTWLTTTSKEDTE